MHENYFKKIPAVNDLLAQQICQELLDNYARDEVLKAIRIVTDQLRQDIRDNYIKNQQTEKINFSSTHILEKVKKVIEKKYEKVLKPVVNGTGVIVHTNLGRSLLADSAADAIHTIAGHYSTLEMDPVTGERGDRYAAVRGLLTDLTGAESVLVVNNNAAAIMLVLSALASAREVVMARGEMVEIGGSFRVPDVMRQSGAQLVEVGTTNKVYAKDYVEAITENTALFMKVHTSNYRIVGFTEHVSAAALTKVAHQHHLPVVEDLGSGMLVDLTKHGLSYEPTVQESIEAGIDVVTFSGDKLLGGPQAGIIIGKKKYIDKLAKHPLTRAFRVDKYTLAALEATLKLYLDPVRARDKIPTLRMLSENDKVCQTKAEELAKNLSLLPNNDNLSYQVEKTKARVGGGAYPLEKISSWGLFMQIKQIPAHKFADQLRAYQTPIFSRITEDRVVIDLKTVQQDELAVIVKAVASCLEEFNNER